MKSLFAALDAAMRKQAQLSVPASKTLAEQHRALRAATDQSKG